MWMSKWFLFEDETIQIFLFRLDLRRKKEEWSNFF